MDQLRLQTRLISEISTFTLVIGLNGLETNKSAEKAQQRVAPFINLIGKLKR